MEKRENTVALRTSKYLFLTTKFREDQESYCPVGLLQEYTITATFWRVRTNTQKRRTQICSHSAGHNRNDVHQHQYDDKRYWRKQLNVKGGESIHLCYRDAAMICRRKNTTSRDKGAKRLKLYNRSCLPLSQIVFVE